MRFLVEERRTYVADSVELRKKFPEEYAEFSEGGGDEEEWVMECIDGGGFEVLDFQDSEYDMDRA